ncbi:MAG: DUF4266 domain-containing protein [Thermoanaerobaculia bacterium]
MTETVRKLLLSFLALLLFAIAGCTTVQPWDRDLLAEKSMSFDPHAMLRSVDDHIYFSKEGSTGGNSVGGGGCGCN